MSERNDILEEIAEIVEEHIDDIVLCGGLGVYALSQAYEAAVDPEYTEDADLIVERVAAKQKSVSNREKKTLAQILHDNGYKRMTKSLPMIEKGLAEEKWEKDGSAFYIEFLTHDHNKESHVISNIVAQGLSYFNMSLENAEDISLPSGKTLRVASAEACILHKALTFTHRIKDEKKYKDLYYICYIAIVLFSSLEDSRNAVLELDVLDNWKKRGQGNLISILEDIETHAPKIKDQDSEGVLTLKNIEEALSALVEN